MSWRVADGEHHRYAFICPVCGKPRGWPTQLQAARQVADLVDSGMPGDLRAETYTDGMDDSCPHGYDGEEPANRRV